MSQAVVCLLSYILFGETKKGSIGITKTPLYMEGKEGFSSHINQLTKKAIN